MRCRICGFTVLDSAPRPYYAPATPHTRRYAAAAGSPELTGYQDGGMNDACDHGSPLPPVDPGPQQPHQLVR